MYLKFIRKFFYKIQRKCMYVLMSNNGDKNDKSNNIDFICQTNELPDGGYKMNRNTQ